MKGKLTNGITEICNDFLRTYAKYLGWKLTKPENIARRLIEQQLYHEYQFLLIAYGWIWAKTGSEVKGNCYSGFLKCYMSDVYEEVAKENDWS